MRGASILSLLGSTLVLVAASAHGAGKSQSGGAGRDVAHGVACKEMHDSIPGGSGSGVPGVSGAPRWGLPGGRAERLRVRRSWSKLSATEKQGVIDAFLKLKQTMAASQGAAARANYKSFCSNYERNLYDYYVELHASAFVSMRTPDMSHFQMVHMGPQFAAWHRYMLLRLEADLRAVSGAPDFTLPYWDWEDCQARPRPERTPAPRSSSPSIWVRRGAATRTTR
jgi:hypothetical protein